MPDMGMSARFIAVLLCGVIFGSLAAISLWTLDHMARRDAALDAHANLVATDLVSALEARLAIGLGLSELPGVDPLLDSARQHLPAFGMIAVLDEEGRGLFSTDPLEIGQVLADASALSSSGQAEVDGQALFWKPITSDHGTLAGAVLLRLPAGLSREGAREFVLRLAVQVGPVVAGLCILATLLGLVLSRRVGRRVEAIESLLSRLDKDRKPLNAGRNGPDELLKLPMSGFEESVHARHRRLMEFERELGRLDEMA